MHKRGLNKKAQVTMFVIVALVLIGLIAGYFLLKPLISGKQIPPSLEPIENYFLDYIEEETSVAAEILGQRAGYIYLPEFEPGSDYMPSSSQLNFLGKGVPYWYYVSGNNIIKEQIPSEKEMESQIEKYLEENVQKCDFFNFAKEGFDVSLGEIKTDVKISGDFIEVAVNADLYISKEEDNAVVSTHKKRVNSQLGKFYQTALELYNKEKQEAFLENYTLDVLYLNAPVTGVEFSCEPQIWHVDEISESIMGSLEQNFLTLRTIGDYYESKKGREYFILDAKTEEAVRFSYSKNWPTKIEVLGEGDTLTAKPVGTQQGLTAMGFCYVPYHFVYDIVHPVLVQIYDEDYVFQFPFIVVIQGNKPRQAMEADYKEQEIQDICKYSNTQISVYTNDLETNPVEADIQFKCFNQLCDIGKTKLSGADAYLLGNFPQCVNGVIIANAQGYQTAKHQISTNQETEADVLLKKLYEIKINPISEIKEPAQRAIISFDSGDYSQTLIWPEQTSINLSEGYYNISVQVYKNSSIFVPGATTKECVETPKSGVLGIIGLTEEKCYDVQIPDQTITSALIGGGENSWYILESELKSSKILNIIFSEFETPRSMEDLQKNYNLAGISKIYPEFKN